MNSEKQKKLEELFRNESVVNKLEQSNTTEELRAALSSYGIELTKEEVEALARSFAAAYAAKGEMTDQELASVSGGVGAEWVFSFVWGVVKETGKAAWNFGRKCATWF